jgi:radical SAM superfamily enzyme YgiQ (UPF0313 family)
MSGDRIPLYLAYEQSHHSPLALGMLAAAAAAADDGNLSRAVDLGSHIHQTKAAIKKDVERRGPGVVLFSHYVWNSAYNLKLAAEIKERWPTAITVHGGPNVPSSESGCSEFMTAYPFVDVAVRGEGEEAVCDILRLISKTGLARCVDELPEIAGISVRSSDLIVRTPDRARQIDLSTFPSPYLAGIFDNKVADAWFAAILETNRGCPYGCTFCDWGSSTLQKIRTFDLDRVKAEIEWMARRSVQAIWIADANFGILERDVEIAEYIVAARSRHGYPRQVVVNYAKNATARVAEVVRILARGGLATDGILALQTTDPDTLRNIRRSNIKTDRYVSLLESFRAERLPVSTDLLLGLPGTNMISFRTDLQFCFDHGVGVKVYRVQILPNSQMADPSYRAAHGIVSDADNYVVSTTSASESDFDAMRELYYLYQVLVGVGLLKYALYFVQAEYGVSAVACLAKIREDIAADHPNLRRLGKVVGILRRKQRIENGKLRFSSRLLLTNWSALYKDVGEYLCESLDVACDSRLRTVLGAHAALMPRVAMRTPVTHSLEHDIVAYFRDLGIGRASAALLSAERRSLASYPTGTLIVSDPHHLCWFPHELLLSYDIHKIHYELQSDLMWEESVPRFFFRPDRWTPLNAMRMAGRVMLEMIRHKAMKVESKRHRVPLSRSQASDT